MALSRQSERVLIADDEPQICTLLREVLTRRGYAVDVCRDGEEVLERFGEGRISLMILDLLMPRKTGIEVIRDLRARGETVPIILMSSFLSEEVLASCREIDRLGFIQKPFSLSDLSEVMERLLRTVRC